MPFAAAERWARGFLHLEPMQKEFSGGQDKGQCSVTSCSRAQPCLLHPWGCGAFPTPLEKTLCPPESLLLPALCTELIALINPANPSLGDGAGVGEEAFGVSCFTEGQIPQQTVGKGTARASLGQPEPNADIRPCQWITHSLQLILVLHKGGDWVFSQHKVGCSKEEAENKQRKVENGNSVYQEETGKARKQNPVASRMRLPEAGYLYSDSLPYIKIRVYIGFSLLLTQRPDTPHQLWGINCQLKYILQQAGEWKVMMISLQLTLAVAAGQGSVLGCPTALVTRFIFQMALQLITYLQVTTLSFSVLYLKENLIY